MAADSPELTARHKAQTTVEMISNGIHSCRGAGFALTKCSNDQHLSSGHPVSEAHGSNGADGGKNRVEQVVAELLRDGIDTDELEDDRVEVSKTLGSC